MLMLRESALTVPAASRVFMTGFSFTGIDMGDSAKYSPYVIRKHGTMGSARARFSVAKRASPGWRFRQSLLVTVKRFENRIERAVGVSFRRPQNPVSFHGTAEWPWNFSQDSPGRRPGLQRSPSLPALGRCTEPRGRSTSFENLCWGLLKETPTARQSTNVFSKC
jgi:hypothetical protein